MSELQISLIVLGVLVILGVIAYNWWQDRRVRQQMQQHLPVVDDDPLLKESGQTLVRREPGLGHLGIEPEHPQNPDTTVMQGQAAALEPLDPGQPLAEPDPVVEEVIELIFSAPKSGQELLNVLDGITSFGRKPVRLFMQLADDGVLNTRINPDGLYTGLHLAVLLANRAGALTAIEWSQIWGNASALAEELDARIEGRDQDQVLARAAELDSTCATLDMQVGLNLILENPRDTEDLIHSAVGVGFVERGVELAWIGEQGLSCFTLGRFDGNPFEVGSETDKLSLLLDVPRSPASETAFARMVEVGAELARRLGASLVDDQGKPLSPGAEVAVDERLQELYGQLEAAGLQAGSERARRVFA